MSKTIGALGILGTVLSGGSLPVILGALGSVLSSQKSESLKEAGKALSAIKNDPELNSKDLHEVLIAELRLKEKEIESTSSWVAEVNDTYRTELSTKDKYARRWRPTFGYCVCVVWSIQMLGATFIMVSQPVIFSELVTAMLALNFMWGMAFSVLGINVLTRTQDKRTEANLKLGNSPQSIISQFLRRPL